MRTRVIAFVAALALAAVALGACSTQARAERKPSSQELPFQPLPAAAHA